VTISGQAKEEQDAKKERKERQAVPLRETERMEKYPPAREGANARDGAAGIKNAAAKEGESEHRQFLEGKADGTMGKEISRLARHE